MVATAGIASADTVDLATYRSRLRDARTLLLQARVAADAQRPALIERVRTTLAQTTGVRAAGGSVIALDDSALARRLAATTTAIDAGIADIDQLVEITDRAAKPPFDLAQANAQLRELATAEETRSGSNDLFAAFGALIARLFPSGNAGLPPGSVELTLAIAGAGLLVVILAILLRGVRERIRREAVQPGAHAEAAASAAIQLAAAERASLSGDPRTALHAFYRYAILTLAERRMLRYEPSLTDRELLARASSLPQLETLRELISLHDRAWFGLKGATAEEADHARALAERAVA
ncbi:MAG: DUF4129 domain-containing protein [Chloroflexi bacterium]|nr:MAG: DUF4129 domain-containing protein [Chloroflexota bacterium]